MFNAQRGARSGTQDQIEKRRTVLCRILIVRRLCCLRRYNLKHIEI